MTKDIHAAYEVLLVRLEKQNRTKS